MTTSALLRSLALVGLLLASASSSVAQSGATVPVKVDHRGLLEIPGVLRASSGHHWGIANLICFGPGWAYSAQDYAIRKDSFKKWSADGATHVEADLNVPGTRIHVRETIRPAKHPDGSPATRVTWVLSHPEGKPLALEKAYVQMTVGIKEFENAPAHSDGVEMLRLPATYSKESLGFPYNTADIALKGPTTTLRVTGKALGVELVDGRAQKQENYALRILFPNSKNASESTIEFCVSGSFPPFTLTAGSDWTPFEFAPDTVQSGSILDFSAITDLGAPAGKFGRVIATPDGHYAFEQKPDEHIRFIGANLCYEANFVAEHDRVDRLAATFRRLGYNTVRFHHTDVTLMKGGWSTWNKGRTGEIDPVMLDRLDYTLSAMKKAGLYVTFDFYAMGSFSLGEENWIQMKARLPIDEAVFNQWAAIVMQWMDHVNPYTGIAWKDDPSVIVICPINEDSIASAWHGAKDRYNALFTEWKKTATDTEGRSEEQLRARFLTELKAASNRKIQAFFRARGVKALFSGSNWWDTQAQTFERDALEVVDNHHYGDHPREGYQKKPMQFNQQSTLKSGNLTYMVPLMKAPSRIYGKPFILTEWNFCPPNQFRAEAGAAMGAYAALQDWDGLYRFAWSHGDKEIDGVHPINGFNIATDPVGLLSERLVVLLFGRRDVQASQKSYVYGVTMKEATEPGLGDMWGRGLFPHRFNALSAVSRIGSQVVEGGRPVVGSFDGVVSGATLTEAQLAGSPQVALSALPDINGTAEIVSDTKELSFNHRKGILRIDTPRTAAIVTPTSETALTAGPLTLTKNTGFASISASALDASNQPLTDSPRILLMRISNVINTGMEFGDKSLRDLFAWGSLPYLAHVGASELTLRHSNPNLKLFALCPDGSRAAELPSTYQDGAYHFTLAIRAGDPAPTMLYELGEP